MLRIFYILLMIPLLWSYWKVLQRLRRERLALTPILGWMVGLGYFLVVPLLLLVLNGGYTIPSFYDANGSYASLDLLDGEYFLPFLVAWVALLFSFQIILTFTSTSTKDEVDTDPPINEKSLNRTLIAALLASILDHALSVWRLGGVDAFLASRWYLRQEDLAIRYGDAFVVYSWLSQANQILFVAASALHAALQIRKRQLNLRISVLILFGLLVQMMMSGNRIFVALFGLSFLTSCWLNRRRKLIAVLLLVSPVMLVFFSAWSFFRHNLSTIAEDIPAYTEADLGSRAVTTLMDGSEAANVLLLLHIVHDFGTRFDYLQGSSYSKALLFLVPRRLYPNKPLSFNVQLASLYEPGQETSLSATQLGELYANFGVLGVVLLPSITLFVLLASERLMRNLDQHLLLSTSLFLLLIWFARSSFADNWVTFFLAALLIWTMKLERGLCLEKRLPV